MPLPWNSGTANLAAAVSEMRGARTIPLHCETQDQFVPRAVLSLILSWHWLARSSWLCEHRPQCKLQCSRVLAILRYGEGFQPHPAVSQMSGCSHLGQSLFSLQT